MELSGGNREDRYGSQRWAGGEAGSATRPGCVPRLAEGTATSEWKLGGAM